MSLRQHRSAHTPKKHLEATISSPGDINISSASRIALAVSSSCPTTPSNRPRRSQNSVHTHRSKPKTTNKSSVKDSTLETLFIRKHPKHTPFTILNNISLCFDGDVDPTKMKGLENVKVVSKASILEGCDVMDSEGVCFHVVTSKLDRLDRSEETTDLESDGGCLRTVTSKLNRLEGSEVTNSESEEDRLCAVPVRRDRLEGCEVTTSQGDDSTCLCTDTLSHVKNNATTSDNESTACLLTMASRSGHSDDETMSDNVDNTCVTSRHARRDVTTSDDDDVVQQVENGRHHQTRWRCGGKRGERRRDPALHAASRLDKRLRYLERETRSMHDDLERLSQGYTTTDAPTARAEHDLRDVILLGEMVATLEGQLERISMRKWRGNNKRHQPDETHVVIT